MSERGWYRGYEKADEDAFWRDIIAGVKRVVVWSVLFVVLVFLWGVLL